MKTFMYLQLFTWVLLLVKCTSINCIDWTSIDDSSSSSSSSDESNDEETEIQLPVDFMNIQHVASATSALEYPYHVMLVSKDKNSVLCQGALISSDWIITTGSCLKKYGGASGNSTSAVMGTVSVHNVEAVIRDLSSVVYHPLFDLNTGVNDVALAKIEPIVENEYVKSIGLSNYEHPMETICIYSSSNENYVYGFSLKLLDWSTCDDIVLSKQTLDYYCAGVNDIQFMTNTFKNMGSPLVCGGRLYSIKTSDGVFTAVNDIDSWVNSILDKSTETYLDWNQRELTL